MPTDGRHIDNPSIPPLLHMRNEGLADVNNAQDVDTKHVQPIVIGGFQKALHLRDPQTINYGINMGDLLEELRRTAHHVLPDCGIEDDTWTLKRRGHLVECVRRRLAMQNHPCPTRMRPL